MSDGDGARESDADAESGEELRERVEEEYDFDDFGPEQMAEMTAEEWEAAFDPDAWVTGTDLLDRVEADLRSRIAARDVFAALERESGEDGERLVAYADDGYAVVHEDGTVEGRGTVLRDVNPSVALASMPEYDVPEPPEDDALPDPETVPEGSGALGNLVLQAVGTLQVAVGGLLVLASLLYDPLLSVFCTRVPRTFLDPAATPTYECAGIPLHPLGGSAIIAGFAGVGFLVFGAFLLVVVANARLSDRFRSEEFRDRLRTVHQGDRPDHVREENDPERDA